MSASLARLGRACGLSMEEHLEHLAGHYPEFDKVREKKRRSLEQTTQGGVFGHFGGSESQLGQLGGSESQLYPVGGDGADDDDDDELDSDEERLYRNPGRL